MRIGRRGFIGSAVLAGAALPFGRLRAQSSGAGAAGAGAGTGAGKPAAADLPARTLSGTEVVLRGADVADFAAGQRGRVLLATDASYDGVRQLWNGMFDYRPALIAQCTGAADVSRAVRFAAAHSLLTAVRGGGHSSSGKSSCEGGLMIDLSPLQGVRVDPKAKRASVAGGSLLGQLDHECALHGLATTAGVVSHTGVGGLTLGGGFGRLGRRFGLACDNIVGADVVLADGRFVRADARNEPELYWALRGGGGNFGVVTNFDLRLHEMNPTVQSGSLGWPIAAAPTVLRTLTDYLASAPDALSAEPVIVSRPDGNALIVLSVFWSDAATASQRWFDGLRGLGPAKPMIDRIGAANYVQIQRAIDDTNHHGIRNYSKSGFLKPLDDAAIGTLLESFRSAPPGSFTLLFQACGGAINRVPIGATAFPNRTSAWWLSAAANWKDAAEDERRIAATRAAWRSMEPLTQGFYTNESGERSAEEYRSNYGANYARLARIKRRYDPQNLFRLNANVLPA